MFYDAFTRLIRTSEFREASSELCWSDFPGIKDIPLDREEKQFDELALFLKAFTLFFSGWPCVFGSDDISSNDVSPKNLK